MKGTFGRLSFDRLSARELAVLKHASEGKTDRHIARSMGIAPGTLGTYWFRIRDKTGLTSRAELTAALARHEHESLLASTITTIAAHVVAFGSESRLVADEIFDQIPIASMVVLRDDTVLKCNETATRKLGPTIRSRRNVASCLDPSSTLDFRLFLEHVYSSFGSARIRVKVWIHEEWTLCQLVGMRIKDHCGILILLLESS